MICYPEGEACVDCGWRNEKVFGRVFVTGGRERAEVTREWRKLYNKDLRDLLLLLFMALVIIIIIIYGSYYY